MRNKNRFLGIILAVLILPIAVLFTACGKGEKDVTISSYEFVDCVTEYKDTDTFSVSGKLVLTYSDGTTEDIVLTDEMLESKPDLKTVGEKKVTYIYNDVKYELTIKVVLSDTTKNKNLAIKKLYETLAKYNVGGHSEDVSMSVDFNYLANVLSLPFSENVNLLEGGLSNEKIQSVEVLSRLVEGLTNSTLNGDNLDILNVIRREIPTVSDEQLQDALDMLSVMEIVNEYDIENLFGILNNITNEDIYDSFIDFVLDDTSAEIYTEKLAGVLDMCLQFIHIDDSELSYEIAYNLVESVRSYESLEELISNSTLEDTHDFTMAIIGHVLENVIPADLVGEYVCEKYDITDETRIAEIKSNIQSVYDLILNEELMEYLTGERELDLIDILINHVIFLNTDAYYAEKLTNAVCGNLSVNSEEGITAFGAYFTENVPVIRALLTGGDDSTINWEGKILELVDLVLTYSEKETIISINFALDCYYNNHLEDLVCALILDDHDFCISRTDSNGEFDEYVTKYVTKIDEIEALYDDLYDAKHGAIKTLVGYAIYREDLETAQAEYIAYMADVQLAKTAIDEKVNTLREEINHFDWSDISCYPEYDGLMISFGLYNKGQFVANMLNDDLIYLSDLEMINDALTSKYGELLTNFVGLNLDTQIWADLVGLAQGTVPSLNSVVENVVITLAGYVSDNSELLKNAVSDIASMVGIEDMEPYYTQIELGEPLTLAQDYFAKFIDASEVETFNKAQFGDSYAQFRASVNTLTSSIDSMITWDVNGTMTSLMTSVKELANLVNELGVNEIAIYQNSNGVVKTIPASYLIMANDILDTEQTTVDKIQKYLPMFVNEGTIKEEFIDIIYTGILGEDWYYLWDGGFNYSDDIYYTNEDAYNACVALVDKHYEAFMTDLFDMNELKVDLLELLNEYARKDVAVTAQLISNLSWDVYINALKNGQTDINIPETIRMDLINTVLNGLTAYKTEISGFLADNLLCVFGLEDADESVKAELDGIVARYVDYCLDMEGVYTVLDFQEIIDDLSAFVTENCKKDTVLGYTIVTNLTGDLFYDLISAVDLTVEFYQDEITEFITHSVGYMLDACVSTSDGSVFVINEDLYSNLALWSTALVEGYIDDTLDLEYFKYSLIEIVQTYAEDEYVIGATIAKNLTGNLALDLFTIHYELLEIYEEEVKAKIAEGIFELIIDPENENYLTTYEASQELAENLTDVVYSGYMNGTLSMDTLLNEVVDTILEAPSLDNLKKLEYIVVILPVIEASGVEMDYNVIFNQLIDIREITHGAIQSINYNALIDEIFYEGFLDDALTIPDVIRTNLVFNGAGELVSETLVYTINFKYRASVMTFDSNFTITLTINY